MTSNPTPDFCPNCQHPQHLPGTECQTPVNHGPNRFHLCLCLARPGAALPCPPQMTCQGGTLGYADIWYLQQGHSLSSADGVISPEVLGPVAVGFPSQGDADPAAAPSVSAVDQTTRDRIAEAIRAAACPGDCGKTEEECARERIQPFVWHHGHLAVVEGTPEQFAAAVLAVLKGVQPSTATGGQPS